MWKFSDRPTNDFKFFELKQSTIPYYTACVLSCNGITNYRVFEIEFEKEEKRVYLGACAIFRFLKKKKIICY